MKVSFVELDKLAGSQIDPDNIASIVTLAVSADGTILGAARANKWSARESGVSAKSGKAYGAEISMEIGSNFGSELFGTTPTGEPINVRTKIGIPLGKRPKQAAASSGGLSPSELRRKLLKLPPDVAKELSSMAEKPAESTPA